VRQTWKLCSILALLPTALSAQVTLSAYGGAVRTAYSGDGPPSTKYHVRLGPVVGVAADFFVASDVAISVQPSYSQRGTNIAFVDVEADKYRDSIAVRTDYVSIPVLAKVFAARQRTFVTGGLDFGYLLSAERDDGSGPTDAKNLFNDYDLSMVFGFGVALHKRRPEITVELRYIHGLLNLADSEAVSAGDEPLPVRFRAAGFQLLGSFGFTLGSGRH